MIFPAPSGILNRTAGSHIGKAPRSNHCAMSLFPFNSVFSSDKSARMSVGYKLRQNGLFHENKAVLSFPFRCNRGLQYLP